jgi:ectoine hydroxylase-related dioxygenase (phytanoyl-CoA dioxygenase family)
MITDFKQEKQITISTPENVVRMNPKKAEKKQALTAVTSRRGAINLSHSLASDYESAWDEANAKLGG